MFSRGSVKQGLRLWGKTDYSFQEVIELVTEMRVLVLFQIAPEHSCER